MHLMKYKKINVRMVLVCTLVIDIKTVKIERNNPAGETLPLFKLKLLKIQS